MQRNKYGFRKTNKVLLLVGLIVFGAAGYYIAAAMEPDTLIYDWMERFWSDVIRHPFSNYWNQYSAACIGIAVLIYVMLCLYYLSNAKNYMRGKEFGTAKFMDAKELNRELADLSTDVTDEKNIVLTKTKKCFHTIYRLERRY